MILEIIQKRNDESNLTIEIEQCKLNVPNDIIKRSQQWLKINNSEIEDDTRVCGDDTCGMIGGFDYDFIFDI